MLNVIKSLLLQIVEDIDCGNSSLSDADSMEVLALLKKYNSKTQVDKDMTVTDICKKYHVTRQTVYNKIKTGEIPKPIKEAGRNPYWKESSIKNSFTKV